MDHMLNKKGNESEYEYIKRLVNGKLIDKTIDADYEELSELIFGEGNCYNSSEVRKRMYGIKHVIDTIDKENIKDVSSDRILTQIEKKKQEMEKEKVKMQTERQRLSQELREEARFELFIDKAVEAIENTSSIDTKNVTPIKPDYKESSGVLMFSDCHYGKELEIKGLHGEILNEYNIEIFKERMWKLFEKTINIIEKEGYKRISVVNLGDELEGMIRIGQLMSLKKGLVESTIEYTYFISNWLNELSKYVYVDFYSTEGNHTDLRLVSGKKGDFPHENISRIIQVFTKEILKDNPNIKIYESESNDKIFFTIQGFNILGIHGEEKNITQAIKDYSFVYDRPIDYIATGHRHHANSANIGVNKGCIGVGSIMGLDDYALKIKRVSNPTATFAIFEEDIGKTIEYTIYLD